MSDNYISELSSLGQIAKFKKLMRPAANISAVADITACTNTKALGDVPDVQKHTSQLKLVTLLIADYQHQKTET